jgi:hypothetical protein
MNGATNPKAKNPNLLIYVSALVAVLAGGAYWWINSGYGEVSRTGFEFAMSLMSVCNRQDKVRLETVISKIEESANHQKLPKKDAETLLKIASWANNGNWSKASASIRRLLDAQVNSTAIPEAGEECCAPKLN